VKIIDAGVIHSECNEVNRLVKNYSNDHTTSGLIDEHRHDHRPEYEKQYVKYQ